MILADDALDEAQGFGGAALQDFVLAALAIDLQQIASAGGRAVYHFVKTDALDRQTLTRVRAALE